MTRINFHNTKSIAFDLEKVEGTQWFSVTVYNEAGETLELTLFDVDLDIFQKALDTMEVSV